MSKTVKLLYPDSDRPVRVNMHKAGAIIADNGPNQPAGSRRAEMSVTGNYHKHIVRATGWRDGLRAMHGRRADETIPVLERAVNELGTEQSMDYWEATPGNVGAALQKLLEWAREYPDGEWWVY